MTIALRRLALGHRDETVQSRMRGKNVIGLDIVLQRQLPVAVDIEAERARITRGADIVAVAAPCDRRDKVVERTGLAVDVDEDPMMPDCGRNRLKAGSAAVLDDVMLVTAMKMRPCSERTGQVIGPGMIRDKSAQSGHMPSLPRDCRAAMAADIVETAHRCQPLSRTSTIGISAMVNRHRIAGVRSQVVGVAGKTPGAGKQAFVLQAAAMLRWCRRRSASPDASASGRSSRSRAHR